jgi:TatD DNase family protein
MKIFETHAHLDFPDYDKDRQTLLEKCFQSGIEHIVNIGIDKKTTQASIKLAKRYPQIFATAGYHPHNADDFVEDSLIELIKSPQVVAIGEVGLDFYRMNAPKDVQLGAFEKQVQIAAQYKMPLVIHSRQAYEQCLQVLSRYDLPKVVFHCFSGDETDARKIIDKGWFISFTGVVTYKNANMDSIVRMVPDEQYFVETDSPYLTPVPHRGKRNSPLNLRHIIEKIAFYKKQTPKTVAQNTFDNASEFFLG